MTKFLGILGVASATALVMAACTVESTTTSNAGDGGTGEGGTGSETSTTDSGSTADTGAKTDAGDDGGACTFPEAFKTGESTCDTCTASKCCGVAQACASDSDCMAIAVCAQPCTEIDAGSGDAGDPVGDCIQTCVDAHPSAGTKFDAAIGCMFGSAGACGSSCN